MQRVMELCERLIAEGRLFAALAECDRAIEAGPSKKDLCNLLQVRVRLRVTIDGRWEGDAVQCLIDALKLTPPGSDVRAQLLATMSAAYASLNNAAGCRRCRDEFCNIYRTRPTRKKQILHPHVEYNLAYALHEADRIREAEVAYLRARDACVNNPDPVAKQLQFHIAHNLVDIFQETGRHEEAFEMMRFAHPHLQESTHGAQVRNRQAIYALSQEDLAAAQLWVESGLGHPSCDVKTRAALHLTNARIAEKLGRMDAAYDEAVEAMRQAALAKCMRLQGRILAFQRSLQGGCEI